MGARSVRSTSQGLAIPAATLSSRENYLDRSSCSGQSAAVNSVKAALLAAPADSQPPRTHRMRCFLERAVARRIHAFLKPDYFKWNRLFSAIQILPARTP